jgi:hypothetical protein
MNVPWRYILGLPCGLLLAIAFYVALLYTQLGIKTQSSRWTYEIVQKKEAIAAATPGPRLLIVGGSSGLFGLDAEVIEQQTGLHTVNFASHAGLGLGYILHLARQTARPGDTILLSLEYEFYSSGFSYSVFDDYILARDPDYFRQMPLLQKIDMATRIPFSRFQKGWSIRSKPEVVRPHAPYVDALNSHGDEIGNAAVDRPPKNSEMDLTANALIDGLPSDDTDGFNELRKFFAWAKANHITVLATFPNILYHPEYDHPVAQRAVQTITNFYASQGVPVIGTAQEAMLPSNQFFNTYYHLTREAALARTQRLIPELEPHLSK